MSDNVVKFKNKKFISKKNSIIDELIKNTVDEILFINNVLRITKGDEYILYNDEEKFNTNSYKMAGELNDFLLDKIKHNSLEQSDIRKIVLLCSLIDDKFYSYIFSGFWYLNLQQKEEILEQFNDELIYILNNSDLSEEDMERKFNKFKSSITGIFDIRVSPEKAAFLVISFNKKHYEEKTDIEFIFGKDFLFIDNKYNPEKMVNEFFINIKKEIDKQMPKKLNKKSKIKKIGINLENSIKNYQYALGLLSENNIKLYQEYKTKAKDYIDIRLDEIIKDKQRLGDKNIAYYKQTKECFNEINGFKSQQKSLKVKKVIF